MTQKKQQETTDEIDDLMDWMVDVFSSNPDQLTESQAANQSPTIDLTQIEVGMTANRVDYVTDGKNWKWFS